MMAAKGLAKLAEECGELVTVIGKRLAYFTADKHPDGSNLVRRLEEEIADVIASCLLVIRHNGLNTYSIKDRAAAKLGRYIRWTKDGSNNTESFDALYADVENFFAAEEIHHIDPEVCLQRVRIKKTGAYGWRAKSDIVQGDLIIQEGLDFTGHLLRPEEYEIVSTVSKSDYLNMRAGGILVLIWLRKRSIPNLDLEAELNDLPEVARLFGDVG